MSRYSREELENMEHKIAEEAEKNRYIPRPKWQLALAWIAVGVVVFAFFGTIYWMMKFKL